MLPECLRRGEPFSRVGNEKDVFLSRTRGCRVRAVPGCHQEYLAIPFRPEDSALRCFRTWFFLGEELLTQEGLSSTSN